MYADSAWNEVMEINDTLMAENQFQVELIYL